jgi:site-specific DNA-methyltransferase (adenine-specific)
LFPDTGPGGRLNGNEKSQTTGNTYGEYNQRSTLTHNDAGSAARFYYCAKATKQDRLGSKHPTVKPVKLMQWLCRLITPPNGYILDPFAGSGTTGSAAVNEGFQIILCENEAEYQADIRKRFRELQNGNGIVMIDENIELDEAPIMVE